MPSHHLPQLAQIHLHWVTDAIQPSCPLSFPSPPAFNLSQHQGLFWWVGSSHQLVKYWNFSISPSKEYSGLISFRNDWFELFTVQGTLKIPPSPQLESIYYSALSLPYGPALTSALDYWKNHTFDYKMATHSNILAWKILWTEEPGRLESDTTEQLHFHFSLSYRATQEQALPPSWSPVIMIFNRRCVFRSIQPYQHPAESSLASYLVLATDFL